MNRELKYGSPLHKHILHALRERKRLWKKKIEESAIKKWDDNEKQYQAYLPETDDDALRRGRRDSGKPEFTTIVIPYSYAILMTSHTYWTSVFLSRNPILQVSARHGEPMMKVEAMTALLDYQIQVGEMLAPFYIWLLDAGKYGLGVLSTYWCEETQTVSAIEERTPSYHGIPIIGKKEKVRVTKKIPGYQGNKVFNVHPRDFIFDPRVPVGKFQEGEFAGRRYDLGWNGLLRGKEISRFYNLDALKQVRRKTLEETRQSVPTVDVPDPTLTADSLFIKDLGFFELTELVVELVPNTWDLGTTEYPEKWIFTVADDEVIIESRPCPEIHGKFPFSVLEYEIGGYELTHRGMLDIIQPLNNAMDWLMNSHMFNIRKSLNDMLVVDPMKVVMADVTDPLAGKIIRLRPEAYGTSVGDAVTQLQVRDVTQNHIKEMDIFAQLMQRITGATDNIMGMVNQGGRRTATESRISSTFGANRLKTNAEYMSIGFGNLAAMMIQNTQQYYSGEKQFKIAGDLIDPSQAFKQITPEDISGFFDYIPVDGTLPVDKFAQANLWRELMAQLGQAPALLAQYDLGRMFAYVAKLSGAVNIEQFKIQTVPDAQAQMLAQAGALVPANGGQGGINRGGDAESFARLAEPGQVGGMGQTS